MTNQMWDRKVARGRTVKIITHQSLDPLRKIKMS